MAKVHVEEALLREPNLWIPHRKPTGEVKIDWTLSITRGLWTCLLFQNGRFGVDHAVGDNYTDSGITYKKSERGEGGLFDGSTSQMYRTNTYGKAVGTGQYTMLYFHRIHGYGEAGYGFFAANRNSSSDGHRMYLHTVQQKYRYAPAADTWDFSPVATFSDIFNKDIFIAVSRRTLLANGSNFRWGYAGGGITASSSFEHSESIDSSQGNESFGDDTASSYARSWDGIFHCAYFWTRYLSNAEIETISADPYHFLIPA